MSQTDARFEKRVLAAKATVSEKLSSLTKKGRVYRPKRSKATGSSVKMRAPNS
ncbi:MAG: hypothetical protein V4682_03215 [Patescibacteria group bacterium]